MTDRPLEHETTVPGDEGAVEASALLQEGIPSPVLIENDITIVETGDGPGLSASLARPFHTQRTEEVFHRRGRPWCWRLS